MAEVTGLGTSALRLPWISAPRKTAPGFAVEAPLSWEALVRLLTRHDVREQKDGPLWAPATYMPGRRRTSDAVLELHALVLDYDSGTTLEEAVAPLLRQGVAWIAHTTASHLKCESQVDVAPRAFAQRGIPATAEGAIRWLEDVRGLRPDILASAIAEPSGSGFRVRHAPIPKFRVVVPFATPVPATLWRGVWAALRDRFAPLGPESDASCSNTNRIYYLPSCREEDFLEADSRHHDGELFDPSDAVEQVRRTLESAPSAPVPSRQTPSGRPTGRGDYRTLDLVAWTRDKGLSPREEGGGEGKIFVTCPWRDEHTDGRQGPLDSYLLDKGDGKPVYKCSHAHCHGRGFWDFLRAVGGADGYCSQTWEPERPVEHPNVQPQEIEEILSGSIPWDLVRTIPERCNRETGEITPARSIPLACEANAAVYLEHAFPRRIRYNELSLSIEVDEIAVNEGWVADQTRRLQRLTGQMFRHTHMEQAMLAVAHDKAFARFHPIRDYLGSLRYDGTPILDDLIDTGILELEDGPTDLYKKYLRSWFIGAVARQMNPGCKMDNALILQGAQGLGKSSFFRRLVQSPAWFCDSMGNLDKDARIMLVRSWIFEWGELETARRADANAVKAFLSAQEDLVRPPYGRAPVHLKRSCVVVGSTNDERFLSDATGSRRFWVLPVRYIAGEEIERYRDRLWAEAVWRWKSGEPWWLSREEEAQQQRVNDQYLILGPWEDAISDWLVPANLHLSPDGGWEITVGEILTQCLGKPRHMQTHHDSIKVGAMLSNMGWERRRPRRGGDRFYVYWRAEP